MRDQIGYGNISTSIEPLDSLEWLLASCDGFSGFDTPKRLSGRPRNLFEDGSGGDIGSACGNKECDDMLWYMLQTNAHTVYHSRARWCRDISYPQTCGGLCPLSWERARLVAWMQETCSPVLGWSGLPQDWINLLEVQASDLNPWPWNVTSLRPGDAERCPSPGGLLGAFAAINIALALVTPISGRRTVLMRVSFGYLGNLDTQTWFPMGVLIAALNIMINFLNAVLIARAPGYENLDVKGLGLLWCTRPRLAWIVVVLVPWGGKDGLYLSSAASSLTAEVILQLISAYVFGHVTNYGRKQRFYSLDRGIGDTEFGRAGLTMYAGAVIWLVVVIFALAACFEAVSGLTARIDGMIGRIWKPSSVEKERECRARYRSLRQDAARLSARLVQQGFSLERDQDRVENADLERSFGFSEQLQEFCTSVQGAWDTIIKTSKRVEQSLTIDYDKYKQVRGEVGDLPAEATPETHDVFTRFEEAQSDLIKIPTQACDEIRIILRERSHAHQQLETHHNDLLRMLRSKRPLAEKMLDWAGLGKVPAQFDLEHAIQASQRKEFLQTLNSMIVHSRLLMDSLQKCRRRWRKAAKCHRPLLEERISKEEIVPDTVLFFLSRTKRRTLKKWVVTTDNVKRRLHLRRFAYIAFLGMIGCWIAQWVWWAGYVQLMGDL